MTSAADIIDFWFRRHGPDDWFAARPEFDAAIAASFAETHAALARGEGFTWRTTPEGRLAEIIVLDQFSRQLFRGRPEAFASDPLALVLAQECVLGGHHQFLLADWRMFALLPYMHAESVLIQKESVRLHTALGLEGPLGHARGHANIVARFGRFPKRNAALGRVSPPEEIAYMAETPGMY